MSDQVLIWLGLIRLAEDELDAAVVGLGDLEWKTIDTHLSVAIERINEARRVLPIASDR